MEVVIGSSGHEQAIIGLFANTFAIAEGADEGELIGGLVKDLLTGTPRHDIRVFRAEAERHLIGAAIFTRLTYPEDARHVVLLSPMAVTSASQRKGVGQALIRHALNALRDEGVEVAITYGDPNYYDRVGFSALTQEQAKPPLPLSFPHGWIGQSLIGSQMRDLQGPSRCVPALDRADIW